MNSSLFIPPFIRRHLGPTEIICEVLFGLIMVLTFTLGAGLIVKEGAEATRQILFGIIGCNIAWGLIDCVMHVMASMLERSRKSRLLKALQVADNENDGLKRIAEHFNPILTPYTTEDERKHLYAAFMKRLQTATTAPTVVLREDLLGGIAKFWLVFLSTIPATLPFLVIDDRFLALRVSNGLLITMLFLVGYRWAQETNNPPWQIGTLFLLCGLILIGVAIALGG